MEGTINKLMEDRFFGFIKGTDGNEYFFHRTCLINKSDWDVCTIGQRVTFEEGESPKGRRAESVLPI